ncbi:MAG: hypothetical protein ACLP0L_18605 [Solirubrobacteraceae bacterium]
MLFGPRNSSDAQSVPDANTVGDHAGQIGCYLTDGVNLYRCLGAIANGMCEMVGLEDCRSLEIILLPAGELPARRLRAVNPTGGD